VNRGFYAFNRVKEMILAKFSISTTFCERGSVTSIALRCDSVMQAI
jgi:hypothetical protein